MNRLSQLLPIEHLRPRVEVTSKKRVFEQAGLLFEQAMGISRSTVTDKLFDRERLGSTGLGHGVAIPHGRINGLKKPAAALITLAAPIPFESPDDAPVSTLIFLLVPEHATSQHLEILSEIAEFLSESTHRDALAGADSAQALRAVIDQWAPAA
jgi:nitrogen PTS system EIIA component